MVECGHSPACIQRRVCAWHCVDHGLFTDLWYRPGVFTQLLGLSSAPELYRDPAEVFAGVSPPYTYVRGFFPKNATINPTNGQQTSSGFKLANIVDVCPIR